MNLPENFELLNSAKYFESYIKEDWGVINLTPHLNYHNFFRNGELTKRVADFLGYHYQKDDGVVINKFASQKSLVNAQFVSTMIMTDGEVKMLDELFGRGKRTNRLGEGRATVYFFKINGKLVMLFHDSRGVATEIESNLTKEEFLDIETDLIKYLYSGFSQEWKDEINLRMGRTK